MQKNLNNIIESLLFVSEEPLTVDKFRQILETVDAKEIRSALQSLGKEYEARGGGFKLAEVAGGWQLRSRPEYNKWLKRMLQPSPQRLSKAALETLAIIAYNQPIIRADIEHIRGVDAGGVLRQLLERKLIRVLGRKEIPGRPLIYATTKLFLELFELRDLKDLPSPKEIEEMSVAAEPEPIIPMPEIDKTPMFETADNATNDQPLPRNEETTNYRVTVVRQYKRSSSQLNNDSISKTNPVILGDKSIISSTPSRLPGKPWKISIRPNSLKKP